MTFDPPKLCYPVEEDDGYVIRIKTGEGSECFDFPLTPENAPTFYTAAVRSAGLLEEECEKDPEMIDLSDPKELRMAVVEQVNTYAESNGLTQDKFYDMCSALTKFVEEGAFPKPTKLTRVK